MNQEQPDFRKGIPVAEASDDAPIKGKVGDDDVVLVRRGGEFFAVGANCTHYGGPLAEGLVEGDEIRCPLHHACFSLRTGQALRAPAFDAIPCWRVERVGDTVFVREKLESAPTPAATSSPMPPSVVIIGGGAAGLAAADTLRKEGYSGPVTIISADDSAPYDRPNLSKDYLAGQAPPEWIPLRTPDYYTERNIDLVLGSRVTAIDPRRKRLQIEGGKSLEYGALLLATGAEPVKIPVPGGSDSRVLYLRTFSDAKALVEKASSAKQVVVVGASFIGLEAAASLRERGIAVHVVAPDNQPLAKVLGEEIGKFYRKLHESHGVVFHLGETVSSYGSGRAVLSGGSTVGADFLLLGVGVRPSLELAERSGLKIDRGVLVNEFLETSAPGIFAAGDLARWPDARTGELVRIEHWVVAERQGQAAAKNILGQRKPFAAVPFFWTQQYGVSLRYIGHAEKWDSVEIDGSLEDLNCSISYVRNGQRLALATIGRDLESLKAEAEMENSETLALRH